MSKLSEDRRIDPRLKALFGEFDFPAQSNAASREEILEQANSEEAKAMRDGLAAFFALCDTEEIAPSDGLTITTETFTSSPDGNTINIQLIKPESDGPLPAVYYIHGGGMASMSCYDPNYKAWGRIIAQNGVAVAMVDFRNCVTPSSAPEVEPYPAGLNDCVAGVKWVSENAVSLGIDASRMIIAGESGGGNLTLATGMKLLRDGDIGLVQGLYALCPYIAGSWPRDDLPSTIENNGILLDLHNNQGAMGYGIDAFEAEDPLAWPLFASSEERGRSAADHDFRQRVRPAARRRHRLLPTPARLWRAGEVSSGDGHDPRHRSLPDGLPRRVARHGEGSGGPGNRLGVARLASPAAERIGQVHRHGLLVPGVRGVSLERDRLSEAA